MKSKALFEAFSYVDDRYLDMVDASEKETIPMKHNHYTLRKTVSFLIAAAICVSVLAITALAAGWIPNIFASVKPDSKEDAAILEAAVSATQSQNVEIVSVPEIDFTEFTLFERYYDGESILLGYDLTKIMPEPIVGFQPDEELFAQITSMKEFEHTPYPGMVDDTLELKVELGVITQEEYDLIMESRTDYAKKYNLHKEWQLTMDHQMKEELSPEQYEQFWKILSETGACCVALPAQPWVGDHILINEVDCGEVLGPDCWSYRSDYTTAEGNCILLNPIPTSVHNLDSVTVELTLRSGWYYWYMELDGDVYSTFESNPPYQATFTLKNKNK